MESSETGVQSIARLGEPMFFHSVIEAGEELRRVDPTVIRRIGETPVSSEVLTPDSDS